MFDNRRGGIVGVAMEILCHQLGDRYRNHFMKCIKRQTSGVGSISRYLDVDRNEIELRRNII